MLSRLKRLGCLASLLFALSPGGCQGRAVQCGTADTQACSCDGGESGVQSCDADGGYGACTCGAADAGADTDASMPDVATGLPYMATCFEAGMPGDCDPAACAPNCTIAGFSHPDYCNKYPNRGTFCTHACTSSSQCPAPSTGCNGMGICKAPGANGGGGAGNGGGGGTGPHDGG